MQKPTRTIEIPSGTGCLRENQKPCILAAYATHMEAYNCKLYGRLLKGGQHPMKCGECLASDANELIQKENA